MKRFMAISLALLLLFTTTRAYAETDLNDAIFDFSYANSTEMKFREKDDYAIEAVYRIVLPEDTAEIHERIVETYGSYRDVYLVDYGYADIQPIKQHLYLCIGVTDDDAMELIDTPLMIIARVFDYTIFHNVEITVV